MQTYGRRAILALMITLPVAACGGRRRRRDERRATRGDLYPNETPQLRRLIVKYARKYDVPVSLVQRVVKRESTHRPSARNGPYYGLMQIHPTTARTMGFRGKPSDLLDAETNLKYAVKYLRGAWLVSDGNQDKAVSWYSRGYYYEAKKRGMLRETGLVS